MQHPFEQNKLTMMMPIQWLTTNTRNVQQHVQKWNARPENVVIFVKEVLDVSVTPKSAQRERKNWAQSVVSPEFHSLHPPVSGSFFFGRDEREKFKRLRNCLLLSLSLSRGKKRKRRETKLLLLISSSSSLILYTCLLLSFFSSFWFRDPALLSLLTLDYY